MPIQPGRVRRALDYRLYVPDLDGMAAKSDSLLLAEVTFLLAEMFSTDRVDGDGHETITARADAWGVTFSLLNELAKRRRGH